MAVKVVVIVLPSSLIIDRIYSLTICTISCLKLRLFPDPPYIRICMNNVLATAPPPSLKTPASASEHESSCLF